MTESQSISLAQLGKLAAITSLSLALNYFIHKMLNSKTNSRDRRLDRSQPNIPRTESVSDILND